MHSKLRSKHSKLQNMERKCVLHICIVPVKHVQRTETLEDLSINNAEYISQAETWAIGTAKYRFPLAIVRSTWIEIRNISALLCYDIHMSKCADILTVVPAQFKACVMFMR